MYTFNSSRPDVLDEIPGLVKVLGADGVVLDELDVVVLRNVSLSIVTDAINHRDAQIFDCPKKIL